MNLLPRSLWLPRLLALVFLLVGTASTALAGKTYSDNSDGTVTDPTTGLTWMRCSMGQTWAGSTCSGTASTYNWDQAVALTGAVSFSGQGDWRLPNIRELQTIVDRSHAYPAIDIAAFPDSPIAYFWSSSSYADGSDHVWSVSFGGGHSGTAGGYLKSDLFAVRMVRGGQSSALLNLDRPASSYVDQGDGTVIHTPTGLRWYRCAWGQTWDGTTCTGAGGTYTWIESNLSSTSTVDIFGTSTSATYNWRLPTEEELLSLVDYTSSSNPAINTTAFPNPPNAYFWSASVYAQDESRAWTVDSGNIYSNSKSLSFHVRRVRTERPTFALTVALSGAGSGNIRSWQLPYIDCGSTCVASYTPQTNVTLIPTARPGSAFAGWSGACTGTGACTLVMNDAKNVIARFNLAPFTVATNGAINTGGVIYEDYCTPGLSCAGESIVTVTTTISFNAADIGKEGSVFVTAVTPASFLGSPGVTDPNAFVLIQLTPLGWERVVADQLVPYASGVLGDQLAAQTILRNTDAKTLLGSQFCVGYGTDASDMINAGRMQMIGTIPNPSATDAGTTSCLVVRPDLTAASTTSTTTTTTTTTTASSTTTTLATIILSLDAGWNLLGNSSSGTVEVLAAFGDTSKLYTVWKWIASAAKWAFYAPSLVGQALSDYAAGKGYEVLNTINGGEGFWVNAKTAFTAQLPALPLMPSTAFQTMPLGWNLIAIGDNKTPSQFNALAGAGTPLTTLWTWNTSLANWYFYAPSLEANGTLSSYITSKGYLDFTTANKTLGPGVGFWVNRP